LLKLDLSHAADAAIDRVVAALRALPASYATGFADLTGGFDSRLMAVLLRAAGHEPTFTTRDSPDGVDTELADRLRTQGGWHWTPTPLPADWPATVTAVLPRALAAGDGRLEALQLSRVLWAHEQLAREGPTLMSAGGGEHFQFYAWQSELLAAGRRTEINLGRWVDTIGMKPVNESVLAPGLSAGVRRHLMAQFARWLEPWAGELNTTQLDVLYAYKSTGHFGAYRNADDHALPALLPFYLKDVFDTAFSIAAQHRNGHRLMREMVTRLDPGAAALPTTRGGPALPIRLRTARRHLPYLAVLGRKGGDKVAQRLLHRRVFSRSVRFAWETAANAAVVRHLEAEGLLEWSQLAAAEALSAQGIASLRTASGDPGFRDTDLLGRLLTVELALRAAR
jgi:hypothetical protein